MGIALDRLRVGMWIAVSGMKNGKTLGFDGVPLLIEAINFPWLACTDGISFGTVDVRHLDIVALNKRYVSVCLSRRVVPAEQATPEAKIEEVDPSLCERCGGRLMLRLGKNDRKWHPLCQECGWDGAQRAGSRT